MWSSHIHNIGDLKVGLPYMWCILNLRWLLKKIDWCLSLNAFEAGMWPHLPNMKHSQRFWNFHVCYLELWPTAQQHLKFSWWICTDWPNKSKTCIMGLRDITDCSTVCSLLTLCEGNPLKISGFPSQRTSNAENISMSLGLDDVLRLVPNVTHLSLVCHRATFSFHSIFCFMGSWPKALTCLYHLRKMIMVIDEIKIFRGLFIYKSSMVLCMFSLFPG